MSEIMLRAEHLGKSYTIRRAGASGYRTLREDLLALPGRVWRTLRERASARETFWALRDVSFELREGEVLGLIGRNGAGKSTLLKIIARITEPSEGEVALYGRVGSLLEVGTGFHPELTGRENIYLSGTILGMRRAEINRRFAEIVAFAEVEQFLDTPVKRYSSGMYMRLAFAVAAHLDPELLLIDEVLAVGDAAFQKKCLGKMGEVARSGRTVLFVSHNMGAVRQLCSQTLLLRQGQVAMLGPTETVIDSYLREGAATAAETDLPPGDPQAPGEATCLRLRGHDGTMRSEFRLGEPWQVELEFVLRRETKHVIAAIGVVSAEAVPVVTIWSQPADLPAGRYLARFAVELPLAAGQFQFVVGLSSYERPFYYLADAGRATVSEAALDEQPLRATGAGLLFSKQRGEITAIR